MHAAATGAKKIDGRPPLNPNLVLFILILASAVAWMSTDLYAPSLAHLPAYFGTSAATVKLTMSLNMLAYAVATLLHGPLSDRFGRRPVLLGGIAAFTLFSFLCAVSATIGQLIGARVLQGLAAAVEGVVVLAIIRDTFDDSEQVRALAIYGMATALVPAAAPILGGYIYIYFGWRMNFYLLAAIALIATILIGIFLEESGRKDMKALVPMQVLQNYLGLLRNRDYLCFTLIGGSTLGFFFAFITAGPFILINTHGLPTQYFGYFQGLAMASFIAGSLLAGRLARHLPSLSIMRFGAAAASTGAIALLIIVYGGLETPATLAIALALTAFGDGPVFAATPSLAMDATQSRTGAAAAMLVAIEIGMGSMAAFAVGVLHDDTSRPLAMTTAALCAVLITCLWLQRGNRAAGAKS